MNDIDKARIELRDQLKHLLQAITDAMPDTATREKDEVRAEAEYTMEHIVDAEVMMVQNGLC